MMRLKSLVLVFTLIVCSSIFGKMTLQEKVHLLFEVSPDSTAELKVINELEIYIQYLHQYDKLNPKNKVKKVFANLKKTYLSRYKSQVYFPEIFSLNYFNCVTGTALTSIVFDELAIPHKMVKIPNHVYLVAYPNSEKIGVESTSQKEGIYDWNEYNKISAINYLINIDKVSVMEVREAGIEATIERYFYVESELNFKNLAGLHFFNKALYYDNMQDKESALTYAQKSNTYDKSDQSDYLMGSILVELIDKTDHQNIDLIHYITLYYNITKTERSKDLLSEAFKYAISEAFFSRDDQNFIDASKRLIKKNLASEHDQNKFIGDLELLRTYWLADQGRYEKAFEVAISGFKISPQNKRYEKLIAQLVIQTLVDNYTENDNMDSILTNYVNHYPFLSESFHFKKYSALFKIYNASEAYFYDEIELGEQYLSKALIILENKEIAKNKDVEIALADAYGSIASYYFREKSQPQAIEWIEKALALDPNSESLKLKKKYIHENMEWHNQDERPPSYESIFMNTEDLESN